MTQNAMISAIGIREVRRRKRPRDSGILFACSPFAFGQGQGLHTLWPNLGYILLPFLFTFMPCCANP